MTDRTYTAGALTALAIVLVVPLLIGALAAIVAYIIGVAQ